MFLPCHRNQRHRPRTSECRRASSDALKTCYDRLVAVLTISSCLLFATTTDAAERIRYKNANGKEVEIVGEAIVTAQDGGQMILTDDGHMLIVQPETVISRETTTEPFTPVDDAEISRRLLEILPDGFAIYRTKNYVIAHNTNEAYVRWVGSLFESLHRGFHSYFKNQGMTLSQPRFPLVALVFANRQSFDQYAKAELGDAGGSVIGYYNLETNRMTTFNVPNPERNVATIIHEATHQLAYNTGLQTRFADNPMWFSEGLAVFFESPNFNNPNGWKGIGWVNTVNLARFRRFQLSRPQDSLITLFSDDLRFRNEATAENAYAEAWAMTYFLIRTKRKEYFQYLRELSESKPLVQLDRRERIEMFQRIFDTDLPSLDRQFLLYMAKVK
ncbi:MAG TPA: hypothetical protein DDZ51_03030 [Planctomycetaceae bacterium]|nr:hypothetical protein [Planctomycetaceae bacterium]